MLFLLFILSIILSPTLANEKICPSSSYQVNALVGLPRFDSKGNLGASNNLADYPIYKCTDDGNGHTSCKWDFSFKTLQNYYTSVLFYPGVAIVMAIITLLLGISVGLARYVFTCRSCNGGGCGKSYPTRKTTCCWKEGCLGYVPVPGTHSRYEYPTRWRWANRVFMIFFALLIFLWIGLGYFEGQSKIASSALVAVDSTAPLAQGIMGTAPAFSTLLENLVGADLTSFIESFNETVINITDPRVVSDQLQCVVTHVEELSVIVGENSTLLAQIEEITNTTAISQMLNDSTSSFDRQKAVLNASINDIKFVTGSFQNVLNSTQMSVNQSMGLATQLLQAENNVTNPQDGIFTIIDDINQQQAHQPSQAVISNATSGSSGSIATILAQPVVAEAERNDLIQKLTTLQTNFSAMPNFSHTADKMLLYNERINLILSQNLTGQLDASVNQTLALLANLTSPFWIQRISTTVTNATATAQNISWEAMYSVLTALNETIPNATEIEDITQSITQITNLTIALPCIGIITDQLAAINESLVQFPDALTDALNKIDDLNATLANFSDYSTDYVNQINEFLETGFMDNITSAQNQIQNIQNDVNKNLNALNDTTILRQIQDATESINVTPLESLHGQLVTLDNALRDSIISDDVISGFRVVAIQQAQLLANLNRQINDLTFWSVGGYCNVANTNCNSSSDCSGDGDVCVGIGQKRCFLQPSMTCDDGTDSPCTSTNSNDYCLVSGPRLTELSLMLNASAIPVADTDRVLNTLRNLNNSLIHDLDSGAIQSLQNSLNSAGTIDITEFDKLLSDAQSMLDVFNVPDVTNQIQSVLDEIAELNMTKLLHDVANLTSISNTVDSALVELYNAQNLTVTISDFLFTKLHVYMDQLSAENLKNVEASSSIGGQYRYVTGVFDDMFSFLHNGSSVYLNATYNVTKSADDLRVFDFFRVLEDPLYTDNGPWHFFWSLKEVIRNDSSVVLPSDPNVSRVTRDAYGNKYPDDKKCFTDSCIQETVDFYHSRSFKTLLIDLGLGKEANSTEVMNGSADQIASAPYLYPFFTAIFGLIGAFLFFPGKLSNWFSTCCASFTAALIFIGLPVIFLLAGGLFPAVLIGGDACVSAEDVGTLYVTQQGDHLCSELDGNGTLRNCELVVSNGSSSTALNYSFVVDLLSVYNSIVHSCDPSNDPLYPVFDSARETVETYIPAQINKYIEDFNSNSTLRLRPNLTKLFSDFGEKIGASAGAFALDLHQSLGCEPLSQTYNDLKNAICCDSMTALYWIAGSWYLIAFTMFCCGIPAAMLGRKRFPDMLWGPDYEQDMHSNLLEYSQNGQAPGAGPTPVENIDEENFRNLENKDIHLENVRVHGHRQSEPIVEGERIHHRDSYVIPADDSNQDESNDSGLPFSVTDDGEGIHLMEASSR